MGIFRNGEKGTYRGDVAALQAALRGDGIPVHVRLDPAVLEDGEEELHLLGCGRVRHGAVGVLVEVGGVDGVEYLLVICGWRCVCVEGCIVLKDG